jgi:hypothetical protein
VEDLPPRTTVVQYPNGTRFLGYEYLGVSGISVKYVTEELACNSNACDNESVDVVRVDHERFARDLGGQLGHSIEVDEEREKDFVGGWAVLVNA